MNVRKILDTTAVLWPKRRCGRRAGPTIVAALTKFPLSVLEAFALQTYPGARSLGEYWGLRWRRRVGPRWPPLLQPVLLGGYVHWVKGQLWWRRRRLRGV